MKDIERAFTVIRLASGSYRYKILLSSDRYLLYKDKKDLLSDTPLLNRAGFTTLNSFEG